MKAKHLLILVLLTVLESSCIRGDYIDYEPDTEAPIILDEPTSEEKTIEQLKLRYLNNPNLFDITLVDWRNVGKYSIIVV